MTSSPTRVFSPLTGGNSLGASASGAFYSDRERGVEAASARVAGDNAGGAPDPLPHSFLTSTAALGASETRLPHSLAAALDALGVREPRQQIERAPAPVQTWDGKGECPW